MKTKPVTETPEKKNPYNQMLTYLLEEKAIFIQDGAGYSILLGKKRIPINASLDNVGLANLFGQFGVSANFTTKGKMHVQDLMVIASEYAQRMSVRKFSAMKDDRIYIPTTKELLEISCGGSRDVPTGSNDDRIWLEHPYNDPLRPNSSVNVRAALKRFEELCVDTAACAVPEMKWFLAMNCALFPF